MNIKCHVRYLNIYYIYALFQLSALQKNVASTLLIYARLNI